MTKMRPNFKRLTDREHLAAMRKLGVKWRPGHLPSYPASMNAESKEQADAHYDAISEAFVDRLTTRTVKVPRGAGRHYVGVHGGQRHVFRSATTPTESSHGELYGAVIGPFKSARGAHFMAEGGGGNPHVQTVSDAERIAKKLNYKPATKR